MNKLDSVTTLLVAAGTVVIFLILFGAQVMALAGLVLVGAHFVLGLDLTWTVAVATVFGIECAIFLINLPGASKYE